MIVLEDCNCFNLLFSSPYMDNGHLRLLLTRPQEWSDTGQTSVQAQPIFFTSLFIFPMMEMCSPKNKVNYLWLLWIYLPWMKLYDSYDKLKLHSTRFLWANFLQTVALKNMWAWEEIRMCIIEFPWLLMIRDTFLFPLDLHAGTANISFHTLTILGTLVLTILNIACTHRWHSPKYRHTFL